MQRSKKEAWRRACCAGRISSDIVGSTLVVIFFIGVLTWVFYGFVCAMNCGMLPAECLVTEIEVVVKVCQGILPDDDFRYYPYGGYVTWCFPVQVPSHSRSQDSSHFRRNRDLISKDEKTLCVTQLASCAEDSAVAYKRMNDSYPLGTRRDCWYGFSTIDTDYNSVYFQWNAPVNLPPWSMVNAYYTVVAGGIIAIVTVFLVVRNCILNQLERIADLDNPSINGDIESRPLLNEAQQLKNNSRID